MPDPPAREKPFTNQDARPTGGVGSRGARASDRQAAGADCDRHALEGSGDGVWDWDLRTNRVYYSQRWQEILGYYSPDEIGTGPEEWQNRIHPDDRAECQANLNLHLSGSRAVYCCEHRLRCQDGHYRWVLGRGKVAERAPDGHPERIVGTLSDIHERKRAEIALKNLIAATAATTGRDFFPALVRYIAEALEVSHTFVTELVGDRLQTLAFWADGALQPDFAYKIIKTPCEQSLLDGNYHCERSVQQEFPEDLDLVGLQVESYMGVALYDSNGRTIGNLCILDRKPLQDSPQTAQLLVAFAMRAATELERQHIEAAQQQQLAAIEAASDGIGILKGDAFTYLNRAFLQLFGCERPDELASWQMMYAPEEAARLEREAFACLDRKRSWQGEATATRRDGSTFAQEISLTLDTDGLVICVCRDVSGRKQAEAELRDSEARYRLLAENTNDLVCLHEPDGRYLFVSPSCQNLLGYHYSEMVGRYPHEFFHPDDRARCQSLESVLESATAEKPAPEIRRLRAKSGDYIWFETLTKPISSGSRERPTRLQTTSRDITERVKAQEQLLYEARHDALTGLPNRMLLLERLQQCLQQLRRNPQRQFALLFLDLDRFKVINDSLGHACGDRVLVAVARTLQAMTRGADLAVRLGGDEFVVLLVDARDVGDAVAAAERISQQLQAPIDLDGREVAIGASIGVLMGSDCYENPDDLLRDADLAMYRAKGQRGVAGHKITTFNADMHARALQRLHLESDLRQALQRKEFCLYYQPIFSLSDRKLISLEALIRWQHPTRGRIAPAEFIPIAEEIGTVVALDRWVIEMACRHLSIWREYAPYAAALRISVNLCASDLQSPELLKDIDRLLAQGVAGRCITLEITESMLIEHPSEAARLLERLRTRDIRVSIDDFGTGYSSLAYLHKLPVDSLKIDRSFVSQMLQDRRSYEIVETIITLSNRLGIKAIAEGVETEAQHDLLTQLGCEFGQGYYFARPMPAAAVEDFLQRHWESRQVI